LGVSFKQAKRCLKEEGLFLNLTYASATAEPTKQQQHQLNISSSRIISNNSTNRHTSNNRDGSKNYSNHNSNNSNNYSSKNYSNNSNKSSKNSSNKSLHHCTLLKILHWSRALKTLSSQWKLSQTLSYEELPNSQPLSEMQNKGKPDAAFPDSPPGDPDTKNADKREESQVPSDINNHVAPVTTSHH